MNKEREIIEFTDDEDELRIGTKWKLNGISYELIDKIENDTIIRRYSDGKYFKSNGDNTMIEVFPRRVTFYD